MKKGTARVFVITLLALLAASPASVYAQKSICMVYFTGIGCPHCAKTDPVLLESLLKEHPNLVIIEYEIYRQQENAPLISVYNSNYNSGLGIPLIIFGSDRSIAGDMPILQSIREEIEKYDSNRCPLFDGSSMSFEDLDINSLPGKPKIWKGERILIPSGKGTDSRMVKRLLTEDNLSEALKEARFSVVEPKEVALSGKTLKFQNAIETNGWTLQWNGEPVTADGCPPCPDPSEWSACMEGKQSRTNYRCSEETGYECVPYEETRECDADQTGGQRPDNASKDLTLTKILSLALVDAVNPCAIAVLTLMLIAIVAYNPENRRNVLLAGFSFILSVYIIYMLYGLVIIRFFQIIQALTSVRLVLYQILGLGAAALGLLNIKDYIRYRPGGILTEMPMRMRPRLKKILEGITSPRGAFMVGAFVTVFLLPCTIGPYVIAGGILSTIELLQTIPWLLFYNLVFVLPMVLITLLVYIGFTSVENVSGWKERNIRYLHLIAGVIMLLLGVAMFLGLI